MAEFDIGYITDLGNVREVNQDRVVAFCNESSALLAVADGMGGMSEGEKASQIVADNIKSWWDINNSIFENTDIDTINQSLWEEILSINNEIVDYSQIKNASMGTTIAALFIKGGKGIIAHSGDSRVYAIRGENVVQLTEDENLYSYIEKYENNQNNIPKNKSILLSYLGKSKNVAINVKLINIKSGDIFLICSDGLYNFINIYNNKIVELINKMKATDFVNLMLNFAKQTSASDNISIAVIKCEKVEEWGKYF